MKKVGCNIKWDSENNTVIATSEEDQICITVGKEFAKVNECTVFYSMSHYLTKSYRYSILFFDKNNKIL